jgi:hypothetical protein
MNVIIFLISSSFCSLLPYRKATDFCIVILNLSTLLKVFMTYERFFGGVFTIF